MNRFSKLAIILIAMLLALVIICPAQASQDVVQSNTLKISAAIDSMVAIEGPFMLTSTGAGLCICGSCSAVQASVTSPGQQNDAYRRAKADVFVSTWANAKGMFLATTNASAIVLLDNADLLNVGSAVMKFPGMASLVSNSLCDMNVGAEQPVMMNVIVNQPRMQTGGEACPALSVPSGVLRDFLSGRSMINLVVA